MRVPPAVMFFRIKDVVRSVVSDLNQPELVQLDVEELALRSMLFCRVPKKHLSLVLQMIDIAYKAGQIQRGS